MSGSFQIAADISRGFFAWYDFERFLRQSEPALASLSPSSGDQLVRVIGRIVLLSEAIPDVVDRKAPCDPPGSSPRAFVSRRRRGVAAIACTLRPSFARQPRLVVTPVDIALASLDIKDEHVESDSTSALVIDGP